MSPQGDFPAPRRRFLPRQTAISPAQDEWFAQLDRVPTSTSSRLLALLDACRGFRVTWRLKKVLVVNMPAGEGVLSVLGIERTGSVEVPWAIGSYKAEFRAFAHTLADAIPGARTYPTPRMWRVKVGDRNVSLTELLDAGDALKTAFAEFGAALDAKDRLGQG